MAPTNERVDQIEQWVDEPVPHPPEAEGGFRRLIKPVGQHDQGKDVMDDDIDPGLEIAEIYVAQQHAVDDEDDQPSPPRKRPE